MPPKGTGLPRQHLEWIDANILAGFIEKALDESYKKNLTAYRNGIYQRFCEHFNITESENDDTKDHRVKFVTYLRNKKAQFVNKSLVDKGRTAGGSGVSISSAWPPPIPSSQCDTRGSHDISKFWSAVFHRDRMTGRSLFARRNRQSMNDWVNAERMKAGQDHTVHPAMLNARAKELWNELDQDEQDAWNVEAKELEEEGASETVRLSENQAILSQSLSAVLSQLIGPLKEGKHKIGNARFHVLYGYRNDDDVVETGYIDVTNNAVDEELAHFCNDYNKDIGYAWTKCCVSTIKENKPEPTVLATSTSFARDSQGLPIFPAPPSDINQLRNVLSDFIQEQWVFCHPNTAFPRKLKSYLADPTLTLIDPLYEKSWAAVATMAESFIAKQDASGGGAFQLFLDKPVQTQPSPTVGEPSLSAVDPHKSPDADQQPVGSPVSNNIPEPAVTTSPTPPVIQHPEVEQKSPKTHIQPDVQPDIPHSTTPSVSTAMTTKPLPETDSQSAEPSENNESGLARIDSGIPPPTGTAANAQRGRKRKAETVLDGNSVAPPLRRSARKPAEGVVPLSKRAQPTSDDVILRSGRVADKASRYFYAVKESPEKLKPKNAGA